MYPQYSATTTASATDVLFKALMKERRVPALRIVPPYYDHPAYLDAVAAVIRDELAKLPWQPEHFVSASTASRRQYAQAATRTPTHVKRTTRGLVERLRLAARASGRRRTSRCSAASEWLRPYTDDVLAKLARQGVKRVFVVTPGFTADCLETIDEIGHESRGVPARRRRAAAPVPVPERPPGLDRGDEDAGDGRGAGWLRER